MQSNISTFILYSKHEPERAAQVAELIAQLPNTKIIAPVFPKYEHVPFIEKLVNKSKERTGKALLRNEIGVILSHRKAWREIVNQKSNPTKHYLILESDSKIYNLTSINAIYPTIDKRFDLFFWGAWNGHVSLKRSTTSKLSNGHYIGEPLIKSVYGAYGYSLNQSAAKHLLKQTGQIKYPVDLYKHYVNPAAITIGAVKRELIGTWLTTQSTIRPETLLDRVKRMARIKIFHCRNQIRAYFC